MVQLISLFNPQTLSHLPILFLVFLDHTFLEVDNIVTDFLKASLWRQVTVLLLGNQAIAQQ
jgi:hypothetical protein